MRQLRFSLEAETALNSQIDYLLEVGAPRAAGALARRVQQFMVDTIAAYPRTGRYLEERDLWETWIPGTPLIAWYVFNDDQVTIATFWHSAQDRSVV